MKVLPRSGTNGSENRLKPRGPGARVKQCPGCRAPFVADADGRCASCGGLWLPAALGHARRLAGKGPVAPFQCADCGAGLKALDVPGPIHEGDLFWGLESARPQGTCVAEGCPRCGGVWVDAANLERAGGALAFGANLRALVRDAS